MSLSTQQGSLYHISWRMDMWWMRWDGICPAECKPVWHWCILGQLVKDSWWRKHVWQRPYSYQGYCEKCSLCTLAKWIWTRGTKHKWDDWFIYHFPYIWARFELCPFVLFIQESFDKFMWSFYSLVFLHWHRDSHVIDSEAVCECCFLVITQAGGKIIWWHNKYNTNIYIYIYTYGPVGMSSYK